MYLIFPAWALPISVTASALVFLGLLVYFCISDLLLNRWFNAAGVEKPIIIQVRSWGEHIRSNSWLVIVCLIAAVLHIYPIFSPILIMGDETIHLQSGLWIYEYIDSDWQAFFQVVFWVFIGLLVIIKKTKIRLCDLLQVDRSNSFLKYILAFIFFGFLVVYFILLKEISFFPISIRYPPVSKFLYFLTYSAFGIDRIFPRMIQLIFYLLSSVYLYRTINLFYEKETALLGASIFLFLPITFAYAYLGELASGTISFIVAISFYFIRFIKDGDNRDLLLTTYLIGTGYLYKDPVFLVFPVCFTVLIFLKIRKQTLFSLLHFKILSLVLVPVIPWMLITKFFSWRNYTLQMHNFTSLDSKFFQYILLVQSNISWVLFTLFILSVGYVLFFKRNKLTGFFGLLFVVYYLFIVSDMAALGPRFSMTFYPTIIIFLSVFISFLIQSIKWKHAFKLCSIALITYLIIISSVSPFNQPFLNIMNRKLHYYPSEKAMKWVDENVIEGEKIMTLRIMTANFYRVKYKIDNNRIIDFWYEFKEISTPEKLKSFYKRNKVSYLMFPYSPKYLSSHDFPILQYLKQNPDKEYMEVARFNLEENEIYVYKLKEDIDR